MSKQKRAAGLGRLVNSSISLTAVKFIVYTILGLIALQFPLAVAAIGSGQKFTLFEFLAPVSGMVFGPWVGALQVVITKVINVGVGPATWTTVEILRLFPLAFAAIYFGNTKKFARYSGIIALAAIIAFIANPIGRQVWFYSLYWLIPVAAAFYKKNPIANALGATFTAHAVGGAPFIWAFNTPKTVWLKLIPVVAAERAFFTLGIIATSYVVSRVLNANFKWSRFPLTAKRSTA